MSPRGGLKRHLVTNLTGEVAAYRCAARGTPDRRRNGGADMAAYGIFVKLLQDERRHGNMPVIAKFTMYRPDADDARLRALIMTTW